MFAIFWGCPFLNAYIAAGPRVPYNALNLPAIPAGPLCFIVAYNVDSPAARRLTRPQLNGPFLPQLAALRGRSHTTKPGTFKLKTFYFFLLSCF